jgi:hypothetical protein
VRYSPGFKRPSRITPRTERAAKGLRIYEAAELRKTIDAACGQSKAMIFLGVNVGVGNADLGTTPLPAFDPKSLQALAARSVDPRLLAAIAFFYNALERVACNSGRLLQKVAVA